MCCFAVSVESLFSSVARTSKDLEHFKFMYLSVQALGCSDFEYMWSLVTIFTPDIYSSSSLVILVVTLLRPSDHFSQVLGGFVSHYMFSKCTECCDLFQGKIRLDVN